MKLEVTGFIGGVEPIQNEQVGMYVQIERTAEVLNQRHGASLGTTGRDADFDDYRTRKDS